MNTYLSILLMEGRLSLPTNAPLLFVKFLRFEVVSCVIINTINHFEQFAL